MGYNVSWGVDVGITPQITWEDHHAVTKFCDGVNSRNEWLHIWVLDPAYGSRLTIDCERNFEVEDEIKLLFSEFFGPRGYHLEGEIDRSGEEFGDVGTYFVKDDDVRYVQWERPANPFKQVEVSA